MTYAITYFAEAAYDITAIKLFEQEVLPELVERGGARPPLPPRPPPLTRPVHTAWGMPRGDHPAHRSPRAVVTR